MNDGSVLVIDRGYADPLAPHGIQQWTAELTTAGGRQTVVTESNAVTAQSTTATRSTPPLTLGQLTTAVRYKSWAPLLTALPTPAAGPPAPSAALLTQQQILTTLKTLLPPSLDVSDVEGAAKGYVDLLVNDGHGPSLLTLTDQQWEPQDPNIAQVFKAAAQQPDGTRLLTRKTPSQDGTGTTQWEADILYPDGHRILVTELNAPAYGLTSTRPQLPLTLGQLATIVRSPSWQ
jgi:hypothetical protein